MTSRHQLYALAVEAASPLHVEPFTPEEARELLASRLGARHSHTDRRAAVHRVLDHYLHTAVAAAVRFNPFRTALQLAPLQPGVVLASVPDREQALAWLEAEAPVLLPLTGYADANGFHEYAWQIPWALAAYFDRRGRWGEARSRIRVPGRLRAGRAAHGSGARALPGPGRPGKRGRGSERIGEAASLSGLGDALSAQRDRQAAQTTWVSSAAILDRLSHPLAESVKARLGQQIPDAH